MKRKIEMPQNTFYRNNVDYFHKITKFNTRQNIVTCELETNTNQYLVHRSYFSLGWACINFPN